MHFAPASQATETQTHTASIWGTAWTKLWPAFLIVVADQISKFIIEQTIQPGEPVRIIGDLLMFTYQLNPAGAMSIRLGPPAFYLVVTLVVASFLTYMLVTKPLHRISRWALTLVLAGAVGNVIDRVRVGAVIDFIDVEFFDFSLPAVNWGPIHVPGDVMTRWPVFNIADASVSIGIVLLLISSFIPERHEKPQDSGA